MSGTAFPFLRNPKYPNLVVTRHPLLSTAG
jgi:hypothetical protein